MGAPPCLPFLDEVFDYLNVSCHRFETKLRPCHSSHLNTVGNLLPFYDDRTPPCRQQNSKNAFQAGRTAKFDPAEINVCENSPSIIVGIHSRPALNFVFDQPKIWRDAPDIANLSGIIRRALGHLAFGTENRSERLAEVSVEQFS